MRILIGLKSFILIQIRDVLEVLILHGLQARFVEVRIPKGLGAKRRRKASYGALRRAGIEDSQPMIARIVYRVNNLFDPVLGQSGVGAFGIGGEQREKQDPPFQKADPKG